MHFWNTNIISFPYAFSKNMPAYAFITAGNMAAVAASLLILLGSIVVFSRKRFVLAVYLANSFMQLAFLQYLSVFYVRYQGPLFLIFIYSYWLLQQPDKGQDRNWQGRIAHFFERPFFLTVRKAASPFVTFVLFVQLAVGVFCYGRDVRYPFTASYEAAGYIREQKLEDTVMVGYIDFLAEPISGLLNRKIYYPQRNDFGTYVVWRDTRRREIISLDEILLSAVGLHQSSRKNVLIILQAPLRDEQGNLLTDREIFDGSRLRFLKEFTRSIVPDERYYLYLIYGGAQVRSVQTLQNS